MSQSHSDESASTTDELHFGQVPEKDRVPLKQKLAYGFGLSADHYAQFGISRLALPFFNILLGVSPAVVSTALAISRGWDAITDPLVGSISDNSKNPKGRRKPFLFWGSILTGLFFPIVWLAPKSMDESAIFVYLMIVFPLFYTFYSLMSVPYESLGMELTPNYKERTSIFTTRNYINEVATLAIPFLLFCQLVSLLGSDHRRTDCQYWRGCHDHHRGRHLLANLPGALSLGRPAPSNGKFAQIGPLTRPQYAAGDDCELHLDLPLRNQQRASPRYVCAYLLHLWWR